MLICCTVLSVSNATETPSTANKVLELRKNGKITISTKGEPVELYLFDVEGRLVEQLSVKQKNHIVSGLKKGSYLYNILQKDTLIETGVINIK